MHEAENFHIYKHTTLTHKHRVLSFVFGGHQLEVRSHCSLAHSPFPLPASRSGAVCWRSPAVCSDDRHWVGQASPRCRRSVRKRKTHTHTRNEFPDQNLKINILKKYDWVRNVPPHKTSASYAHTHTHTHTHTGRLEGHARNALANDLLTELRLFACLENRSHSCGLPSSGSADKETTHMTPVSARPPPFDDFVNLNLLSSSAWEM